MNKYNIYAEKTKKQKNKKTIGPTDDYVFLTCIYQKMKKYFQRVNSPETIMIMLSS